MIKLFRTYFYIKQLDRFQKPRELYVATNSPKNIQTRLKTSKLNKFIPKYRK